MPRRSVKIKRARMHAEVMATVGQPDDDAPKVITCYWSTCTKELEHPSVLCVYHTRQFELNGGHIPNGR
jgi:hypothetical protein